MVFSIRDGSLFFCEAKSLDLNQDKMPGKI